MSFARQVAEFCRRDLLTERRAGEVVSIVTPFGAVALMSFPLAFGIDSALLSRVGPAVMSRRMPTTVNRVPPRRDVSTAEWHRTAAALPYGHA